MDADTTSLTAANLLIFVNNALESLIGKIINADGVWQYDDTNYSDLPIGTGTLVNGQESYSFADEYLDILWVFFNYLFRAKNYGYNYFKFMG